LSELVVVANRGPATINVAPDGSLTVGTGAGGLAPSLARALDGRDSTFVAAAMSEGERRAAREGLPEAIAGCDLSLVEVEEALHRAAYGVVSNQLLWYLHHGLFDLPRRPLLDHHFAAAFEAYREFNRLFAEAAAAHADEGATVVVHDYHLCLVGAFLRRSRPDLKTAHFSHTPFATPEELEVLPEVVRAELLDGLSSFGACGFHTERWRERFARSAAGRAAAESFVAPLGTDALSFGHLAESEEVLARGRLLDELVDGRQLLLRSDRVELSKNLLRGFLAYEELLAERPQLRGGVVFVARLYASRTDLADYLAYRAETEQLAARINERFGNAGWSPVVVQIADDFPATVAAFRRYDVLLVNPVRDGMNLVAKEGPVVNGRDGVLVLSRQAGAFEELGADALAVNPFDVSGTARALGEALAMPAAERAPRAARLAAASAALPPGPWHDVVIGHARRATAGG